MTEAVWRVVGASVAGTSHVERGTPCQDAHAFQVFPSGLVIATADGAGTAARSDEGARLAVECAVAALGAVLDVAPDDAESWGRVMVETFAQARAALEALAGEEEAPLRDFATTLTCVAATDDWLVVGQLGDGLVVLEDTDGTLAAAVQPQRGEYANEAMFLTMPNAVDWLAVEATPRAVDGVAVITDGLLRLAARVPGYEPFGPFFKPLLRFAAEATDDAATEDLARFLESERVTARTDDDKTLVVAARVPLTVEVVGPPAGAGDAAEDEG